MVKVFLRYRGYSIEELAEKASFLELSYLLIFFGGIAYGNTTK
jgi:citrate synthase